MSENNREKVRALIEDQEMDVRRKSMLSRYAQILSFRIETNGLPTDVRAALRIHEKYLLSELLQTYE